LSDSPAVASSRARDSTIHGGATLPPEAVGRHIPRSPDHSENATAGVREPTAAGSVPRPTGTAAVPQTTAMAEDRGARERVAAADVLPSPRRARLARLASATVLSSSPFLLILGLKPFTFGIWFQAEPITVGLLALGCLAALCLLLLDVTGHRVWPVFREPPLLCLLALIVWSAVVSPLQHFPARSWFGTPETGEGIFAFLALLSLSALGWVVWPYREIRGNLCTAAVVAAVFVGALNLLPLGSPWRPQLLGFYGGIVGPAVALVVGGAKPWQERWAARPAFFAGLPAVLSSQSKIALSLYCVVGPFARLLIQRWQGRWQPRRRRQALTCMPLLAPAAATLATAIGMVMPPMDIYAFLPHRAADTVLDFVSAGATGTDVFYSLRSRARLALAGLGALQAHPQGWLTGFGWGSFDSLLYRHTYIAGVRGFQDGVWQPNWEAIGAGAFHAHSDPLEALLAAGLPAAILYLAFLGAIVWRSRRAMLPFAAVGWFIIAGLLSAWYPSMLDYPFLALALVACCAPWRPAPLRQAMSLRQTLPLRRAMPLRQALPSRTLGWRGACLAGATALAFGAWATAIDALAGGRLLAALNRQNPAEVADFSSIPRDHGRGGVHLWWAALNYVYFIDSRLAQGHKPTEAQALWYARLLRAVDHWTEEGRADVRLAALTAAMRNDLAANHADTALASLRRRALKHWDTAVVDLIRRAPDRTDVAVPDLAALTAAKQYMAILSLCGQIFHIHPGDRVCLWYSGVTLLTDPGSQQAAFIDLRRALSLGVDAVAPVTPAARQAVLGHFPPPRDGSK